MKKDIKEKFKSILNKSIRSVDYIDQGFNNENYNINSTYVMRLTTEHRDPTLIPKNEAETYNAISKLNISDKVVYFNEEDGTKISKFVHNSFKYINTPTNEQIILVAKKLKKLHNSEIKVSHNYMMFNRLNVYKKEVDNNLFLDQKKEERIINSVRQIFMKAPIVLCHNDLVKGNLLFKFNDVVLIDWEYASMNNLLFDLASFVSENNLTEEQEILFLQKYYGAKYSSQKKKNVDTFAAFQDILFYYWSQMLYKKRGDEIFKIIANDKLNRFNNYN